MYGLTSRPDFQSGHGGGFAARRAGSLFRSHSFRLADAIESMQRADEDLSVGDRGRGVAFIAKWSLADELEPETGFKDVGSARVIRKIKIVAGRDWRSAVVLAQPLRPAAFPGLCRDTTGDAIVINPKEVLAVGNGR